MNPVSKFTPKYRREKTNLSNPDLVKKEDAVEVFCRLRPLSNNEDSSSIKLLSPTTLALATPAESRGVHKEVHYTFKHIFTAYSNQNEVFEHVAFPLLEDLLKGKNALLFTYGVTGSGKTHTLSGSYDNPGIMPKCIFTIFNSIEDFQAPKYVIKSDKMNGFEVQSSDEAMQDQFNELRGTSKTPKSTKKVVRDKTFLNDGGRIVDINQNNLYSVFISYIEIYNNTVFDLLDESNTRSLQSKILREGPNKSMYVNGMIEAEVKSAEEAFELFNLGQKRKRMANTVLNSVSSRSHSIFNIRIVQLQQKTYNEEGNPTIPDTNLLKVAQLSLVDLAGSERTTRTQNTGAQLKEASQINNSLLSLRTCLQILRDNQLTAGNRLVPYRDSRLTLLFKNYFEGEGRVRMIICVNPSNADFEENFQVMKFAESTQDVKITRSEPKYTPCRKKTPRKIITPGIVKTKFFDSLGPKLPTITMNFTDFEDSKLVFDRFYNTLKNRQQKLATYSADWDLKVDHFRKRLLDVQQENVLGKSELQSLKSLVKKEKVRQSCTERKLSDAEMKILELQTKNKELEDQIYSLRNTVAEKDLKINKNILEKEKTRQKLVLQNEKMTHELDAKLRRQREHYAAAVEAKDNKLRKVKEFLDNELTPPEIKEIQSRPQINVPSMESQYQTPRNLNRRPGPGTPAVRQRRSRSAGEVWLEHNVIKPVPLNTVLQPSMKKRKSLTKLSKASDITSPKQSKYCLLTQDMDSDGDVETKVFKGDIIPTCGGGAQVIFHDVEKLKQQSPTSNK